MNKKIIGSIDSIEDVVLRWMHAPAERDRQRLESYVLNRFKAGFSFYNRFPGGSGSLKEVFPIDCDGKAVNPSQHCLALAVMRNSSRSQKQILIEMDCLAQLQEHGIPVISMLSRKDQCIILGDRVGYLMKWMPHAVQFEVKTFSPKLNFVLILSILLGVGGQVDSSEYGKIQAVKLVLSKLQQPDVRINKEFLTNMRMGITEIFKFPYYIHDFQFLVDACSGKIAVIDPLVILNKEQIKSENQGVKDFVRNTGLWLKKFWTFLDFINNLVETESEQAVIDKLQSYLNRL